MAPIVSISPPSRTRMKARPPAPAFWASLNTSPPGLMRTLLRASLPPGTGSTFTEPPAATAPENTLKPMPSTRSDTFTSSMP
jgi:hypothetical protein